MKITVSAWRYDEDSTSDETYEVEVSWDSVPPKVKAEIINQINDALSNAELMAPVDVQFWYHVKAKVEVESAPVETQLTEIKQTLESFAEELPLWWKTGAVQRAEAWAGVTELTPDAVAARIRSIAAQIK